MDNKLPELWVATDMNGSVMVYDAEPDFDGETFEATSCVEDLKHINTKVPRGHKVRYSPVCVEDCRPPGIPELWIERSKSLGSLCCYIRGALVWRRNASFEAYELVQAGHRCRIAWDENGIRLIGEPVAI